ncbi:maleylpyruvate isomerase N-terminal domain-containing protein [Streptomyces rapamycinicus]|uniref:Mycothiol-dependent maleylpyruvate isomerase metal-binding domain-containing protein n=1 Tax=Streptomyces rapamycinicus (strain ATCC 29253 / DSM 41530 / NRRL 5491 / AYB-994) TaxID=1343740 RepID=A0A0A0NPF8_STRRN|nr:maleylpyruvate isomerase N-terminal domain-containing protein [Streptomyces rapamycinicus]AGP61457.1 hypothetical protein M271_50505 [Streptomyces rapamycinicus NRRL 5491]RLV71695.1 hypothetical protein D3C57_144250 [Streptomyces rapamycinicus NRRL 5491]UTP37603.1 maleylpyruvate isomerase N-terminal domain-containing protein [Streptomyces rapamycinicus NRRL 5491]
MTHSSLQLIPDAINRFGARVHAVDGHRWNDSTPCTEWTVRDLVNHLVSEHLWVPHLLAGESLEQVGDRYDGDMVGADPVRACIHEWGLARGCGQPEWLDPAAVDHSLAYARANAERVAGLGIFAAPVRTTSTDPAVQLLSLLGRAV